MAQRIIRSYNFDKYKSDSLDEIQELLDQDYKVKSSIQMNDDYIEYILEK